MKNKKNILIVGGAGFIGSNLVQKAIKLNYKVYSLSKNKYKKKINKVTYITLDLKKKKKLFEVINSINFEYVIYSSGYIQHKDFNIEGFAYINEKLLGILIFALTCTIVSFQLKNKFKAN